MKRSLSAPCAGWAERLAAVHPDDLSPSARAALDAHVASCLACAAARAEYLLMDARMHDLPPTAPLPSLPPRLAQIWAAQSARSAEKRVQWNGRGAIGVTGRSHSGSEQRMRTMKQSPTHQKPQHDPQRRPISWISGSATAAVVLLFALVLLTFARGQRPGSSAPPHATSPAIHVTPTFIPPYGGRLYATYLGKDGRVHSVSPDGKQDLPGPVLADSTIISQPFLGWANAAASPDGRYLAYIAGSDLNGSGAVAIVDMATGESVRASVMCSELFWSPDSTRLVADDYGSNGMGPVYVIDARTGRAAKVVATYQGHSMTIPRAIGWIDRAHAAVLVDQPAATARIPSTTGAGRQLSALSASLSGGGYLGLAALDVSSGAVRYLANVLSPPDVFLAPDGKEIFVASSLWQSTAEVIDTATGKVRPLPTITSAFAGQFVNIDNLDYAEGGNWATHTAWKPGTHILAISLGAWGPGTEGGPPRAQQQAGVWLLDLDGDSATQITHDTYPLAWLSDGHALLISDLPPASVVFGGRSVGPTMSELAPVARGAPQVVLTRSMVAFFGLAQVQRG